MPAVMDNLLVAVRHSLDTSQAKSTEDLTVSLASNATRICDGEIEFEEAEDHASKKMLEHLKAKCIMLNSASADLPEPPSKSKENNNVLAKKIEQRKPRPSLPEPKVTLYNPDMVNLGWKGNTPVGAGMINVGNTCYLNSTLQALFHVPALVNWLLSDAHHRTKCEQAGKKMHFKFPFKSHKPKDGAGECLTCAMASTLKFSHETSITPFKPSSIYNKLRLICRTMQLGQQEDAHEFLRYLLEGMERAYLVRNQATKFDSYSKETTPINQIFGGYIRTEVKCLECKHISTTFQHFQDLLVDIRKASTLDEAMTSYFSQEQLDNNDYKCEACKKRVPATKQFSLERPPKVLCVQLKRFSVMGNKISRHIDFKESIDMGPYLRREHGEPVKPLIYKLTSMVTHMGPSVNCGHYTAVAKVSSGQYYCFDDSCVRAVGLNQVLSTNAYIMIFEMESQSQNSLSRSKVLKLNGAVPKSLSPMTNGFAHKVSSASPKPAMIPLGNSSMMNGNCTTPKRKDNNSAEELYTQKSTNFIGPQLPQKMQDKPQPKLIYNNNNNNNSGKSHNSKEQPNGKTKASLVPYGISSDEEENGATPKSDNNSCSGNSSQNGKASSPNSPHRTVLVNSSSNESPSRALVSHKDSPSKSSKFNGNGTSSQSPKYIENSYAPKTFKSPNDKFKSSSNGNFTNGSSKYQNGKSEENGGRVESNGKDKWSSPHKIKTDEEKIPTKASASRLLDKSSSQPAAVATTNGWSVTDYKDESVKSSSYSSNSNHNSTTPAEMRNFKGTNHSDTTPRLMKTSERGYGSSNVASWNGTRPQMDRDVDSERRNERLKRRHYEDDDIDRGRVKKIKGNHHCDYDNRSNPGYNPFNNYSQDRSYNKPYNNKPNPHYNKNNRYYNTTSNGRPRQFNNHSHRNYKFQNHQQKRWKR